MILSKSWVHRKRYDTASTFITPELVFSIRREGIGKGLFVDQQVGDHERNICYDASGYQCSN